MVLSAVPCIARPVRIPGLVRPVPDPQFEVVMSMPLVQLGPGGDYVRRLVADGDRLRVVSRAFEVGLPDGRLVQAVPRTRSSVSPVRRLLRWLGLLQDERVEDSSIPAEAPAPEIPMPIDPAVARRYHEPANDPFAVRCDRGGLEAMAGIDRLEISRTALCSSRSLRGSQEVRSEIRPSDLGPDESVHPPLPSPEVELLRSTSSAIGGLRVDLARVTAQAVLEHRRRGGLRPISGSGRDSQANATAGCSTEFRHSPSAHPSPRESTRESHAEATSCSGLRSHLSGEQRLFPDHAGNRGR
ncbi:MAG: hypothetical protein CMJ51_05720, partial [Planctomycetaceae bacterium]|nr:hypothetical protein [Planctomycetaceae bacterium]